jgi:hypothetical protein
VLNRGTGVSNTPAGVVQMRDTSNNNVATATSIVEGLVRECDAYTEIQDASTIQVGYTFHDVKSVFTARVSSVITVPSPQSMCGFYLLVRTSDPMYDVVVSDNFTKLVPKAKGDVITSMVFPSDGQTVSLYPIQSSFKSVQSMSNEVKGLSPTNAVTDRDAAIHDAATLWALAMFIKGEIKCNETVDNVKIPVIVRDSTTCPMSVTQLNAMGEFISNMNLDTIEQQLNDDPYCTVNLANVVSELENAIPSSCAPELQFMLQASNSFMAKAGSNTTVAEETQAIVLDALAKSAVKRRNLLVHLPCGKVAKAFYGYMSVGVYIGCEIHNFREFINSLPTPKGYMF